MTPDPSASGASEQRRERILELVRSHDFVRVGDLGEMLGVSSVTVRGDLDVLAARGELRRIRGGAVSQEPRRAVAAGDARELTAIAQEAVALVSDDECVFVGGGDFAPALAQAIAERRGLTGVAIVTNDLGVATALQPAIPRLTVMVTGGTLARRHASLVDPLGDLMFGRLHGHVALVGAEGVDARAGVTAPDLGEAAATRRMLEAAERRVVLAIGSTVGVVQMAPVCAIDDVDVLVTGAGSEPAALEALRTRGVEAARMVLDPAFTVAAVDDRIFGSFVEHMGRAVYGGIYEPGHPTADADGFRGDVLALVRELGVTIVRYPGGNFVSGYHWEDGVGPREKRPVRLDLAWRSLEPNLVGTDEFLAWAKRAGADPMLAVNLGTAGIDSARALVEYCNSPAGSAFADRRASNGHPDPYGVRVWCLGNEMDGPWQIGHMTAAEYGRIANETGKAMRLVDPSIELVVCGSSNSAMPTFGAWEDTVLDLAWEVADYVSLHTYYDPDSYESVDAFLACSLDLDRMIDTVAATADSVAGRKGSRRRVPLSVDEWNVWHQTGNPGYRRRDVPFERAPAITEDDHTVADALVVGCLLITLLRHADRVRMACLAQLVNVIPPIRTLDGGPAWRQTSYFPFLHASRHGRGTVLRVEPDAPSYEVPGEGSVCALEATAVHGDGELTVFAVNRGAEPLALEARVRDLPELARCEHVALFDQDVGATNTAERPDRVTPAAVPGARLDGGVLRAELPPRSWNVVRLSP